MPFRHDLTVPPFNQTDSGILGLLLSRRSGSAKAMTGPGPDAAQLDAILTCGARAPDHGKLFPWRFIIFEGGARARAGDILAEVAQADGLHQHQVEEERGRFLRAPIVVGVISRVREKISIPVWEQELSAGAVCQNILLAAAGLGFVANWITEWYAYHPLVKEKLGLKPGERVAGFIYIGQPGVEQEERLRPDMDNLASRF